jgi:hypothetical protein
MTMSRRGRARGLSLSTFVGIVLASALGRAAPCPSTVPAAAEERRALARDWFKEGEVAERGKDDLGAIRAYRCSMKMVPHAFTAYNLARVAEHAGDLELALDGYRQYLGLRPEADDRAAIEQQMQQLETRIAAARGTNAAPPPADPAPPASIPPPPPSPQSAGERVGVRGVASPPPPVEATAPPSDPAPLSLPAAPDAPPPWRPGTVAWIVAGSGAVALAAGTAFNLMARAQMSDCRALNDAGDVPAARDACHRAGPYAYASYALFGAAGAAAMAEVGLWWHHRGREVAVAPLPGGVAVAFAKSF